MTRADGRAQGSTAARVLTGLAIATGVVCILIGVYHLALGIASVPGEEGTGPTVDSRERFYNAVFVGYGAAWIWVARQRPLRIDLVVGLSAVFLLGALGRIVSVLVWGPPRWFQVVLTGVEVVFPAICLGLAWRAHRARRVLGDSP